jgi:hypothetical protein
VKTRLLFLAVVTPFAVLARPIWRRRLGLGFDRGAGTYWSDRSGEKIDRDALRLKP